MNATESIKMQVKAKLAKPCPCCGSKNVLMDNPKWIKAHSLNMVTIQCEDCKLEMNGHAGYSFVKDETITLQQAYQSALRRWNRRVAA